MKSCSQRDIPVSKIIFVCASSNCFLKMWRYGMISLANSFGSRLMISCCVRPSLCKIRYHMPVGYGSQLVYRLCVILDLDSINQWSQQVMSQGSTAIWTPFSTTIKQRWWFYRKPSYEWGCWLQDELLVRQGFGCPTDPGWQFDNTNVASSRWNRTLNHLEDRNWCDGYDGCPVEFYEYLR